MTRPWRVVVVDDDFRVAGVHADIVDGTSGFEAVGTARSLAEARSLVRDRQPDLVLADVFLPDGDGIEFIATAGVDAFILSAIDSPEQVRRAVRHGALGVLIKPFARRALADHLERYARYRNLLGEGEAVAQDTVERALAVLHGTQAPGSTSRQVTEKVVLEAIGGQDSSAAEVAERAGVSRATAQRRLAALASRGVVEVRLRYGTSGRPEHRYALAADEGTH